MQIGFPKRQSTSIVPPLNVLYSFYPSNSGVDFVKSIVGCIQLQLKKFIREFAQSRKENITWWNIANSKDVPSSLFQIVGEFLSSTDEQTI